MPGKPFGYREISGPSRVEFGGESGQAEFITNAVSRPETFHVDMEYRH